VTRYQNLAVAAPLSKAVAKRARSCRMQRDLGLLDRYQRNQSTRLPLEKSYQDPERTERSIRHVDRWEAPGILGARDALAKLERLHMPYTVRIDAFDSRDHKRQVFLDSPLYGRVLFLHAFENRSCVSSFSVEDLPLVGLLQCANFARIQVVKTHPGQEIVERSKPGKACRVHEIQAIIRSWWGYLVWSRHDLTFAHEVVRAVDTALLAFHHIAAAGFRTDLERERSCRTIR